MEKKINIAIDAMGGENSPKKVLDGINISLKSNKENHFLLYGDKDLLLNEISIPPIIFAGEFSPPIASIAIFIFFSI